MSESARKPKLFWPLSSAGVLDSLFLALLIVLSVWHYASRLAFYSDDWGFLGLMATAEHQSLWDLVHRQWTLIASLRMRPTQIVYQAVLFRLFEVQPLGYQAANAMVMIAMAVLLYWALRELGLPRTVCIAIPAVFALMPNYSTDRFWFSAFGYTLSMAFAFLSLYADLRGVRSGSRTLLLWKALTLVALLIAGLGHEVALPLFLLNVGLVWVRAGKIWAGGLRARLGNAGAAAYLGSNIVLVAAIVGYKLATTGPTGATGNYILYVARLLIGAVATNYGTYGIGMPQAVWWGIRSSSTAILATAVVVGILVFGYVAALVAVDGDRLVRRGLWLRTLVAGLLVFVAGYAVFLGAARIGFSSTGIYNRVNIAAALGVAITLVAIIGWLGTRLKVASVRRWWFSGAVAFWCMGSLLVVNGLAVSWAEAWQREQAILANIQSRVPTLPSHSTIILDGVCPYVGPAIVFDSSWDLAGALQTRYRDQTLRADVNSSRLVVRRDGIFTTVHGGPGTAAFHSYGPRLFLFQAPTGILVPLPDAESAGRYLDKSMGDRCRGGPGRGVTIFPIDRLYQRLEVRFFRL